MCPCVGLQMLCEERGSFLEIADVVKGLGLTILKGVMESRNGKIWAHFTVEVCPECLSTIKSTNFKNFDDFLKPFIVFTG